MRDKWGAQFTLRPTTEEGELRPRYPREELLVRKFILPKRRKRLMLLLRSDKGRAIFLEGIGHTSDIDLRFARPILDELQTPSGIVNLLRERFVNDPVYVISADRMLDGRELPLTDAVSLLFESKYCGMVSCLDGRVVYYKGAERGAHYLLERAHI